MALTKVLALEASGIVEKIIDTGSGGGGSLTKQTIDLSNGQTAVVVPGGYIPDGIIVYLNGAYLSPAEYTATVSPDITLATGAPSDDSVLDVIVLSHTITSDGITASNITDMAMDTLDVVNMLSPHFYRKSVGIAQVFSSGTTGTYGNPAYGDSVSGYSNSGSGALVVQGLGEIQLITGTTASGYAYVYKYLSPTLGASAYNPYSVVGSSTAVGSKLAASAVVYVDALSDAIDTYTARVSLLGQGPYGATSAPGATDPGFTLSYTHSVNSGNWVINYRGSDNSLKTLNTSVAPVVGLVAAMRIVAKAHRTAAGVATVTIDIGGTIYTITDSAFNSSSAYYNVAVSGRIIKSVGTTSRTLGMRHCSAARNLP